MQTQSQVNERFQAALTSLIGKLEEDYYVLAAVLYGSLARGEAWERSDIDMIIILRDGQERENREIWIVEDDINIFATVISRNRFKRMLEGSLQGSIIHSVRSQFKLLFTKDESIRTWIQESAHIEQRDQKYGLLRHAAGIPYYLDKVHKWLEVKKDLDYCFLWLLLTVNQMARVEVVLNGEAPSREALDQAMQYNPEFFKAVYTDVIHEPINETALRKALARIEDYLDAHTEALFKPVLDFLSAYQGPCTASELNDQFRKKVQGETLGYIYEWLARKGIIHKLSSSILLTRKSQISLEEAAYYYETDDKSEWE